MILIIGGVSQGKTDYAKKSYPGYKCFDDFAQWFREKMINEEDPEGEVENFLKNNPESVIISDEVGSGIVPMERFEREYRERLGRCLIKIAKEADSVVRIFCGIATVIK